MALKTSFKGFMRHVNKFARVTYPYGIEAFQAIKPLSPQQKAQARADRICQEKEDRQARVDRVVMWTGITLLIVLYCALDIGLYAWLLS